MLRHALVLEHMLTYVQNCRFHFVYRCEEEADAVGGRWYSDFEKSVVDHLQRKMIPNPTALSTIQGRKAMDIFWHHRARQFCFACHPLIFPHGNDYDICRCELFNHFIGKRWLCIPCFLSEEVTAVNKFLPDTQADKSPLSSVKPEVSLGSLQEFVGRTGTD